MPPTDTTLLLRAHAEHHWLQTELIPVLRQLEDPCQFLEGGGGGLPAYLEMAWAEAARRARHPARVPAWGGGLSPPRRGAGACLPGASVAGVPSVPRATPARSHPPGAGRPPGPRGSPFGASTA